MPETLYRPKHNPPSSLDNYFAHALEFWIAVGSILIGLMMLGTSFTREMNVAPAVDFLPVVISAIMGFILCAGGLLMMRSIFKNYESIDLQFLDRGISLVTQAVGWFSWGVALVLGPKPTYWTAVVVTLVMTIGMVSTLYPNMNYLRRLKKSTLPDKE